MTTEFDGTLDTPARIRFWTCPNPAHKTVDWDGNVATCRDCGLTSTMTERKYRTVEQIARQYRERAEAAEADLAVAQQEARREKAMHRMARLHAADADTREADAVAEAARADARHKTEYAARLRETADRLKAETQRDDARAALHALGEVAEHIKHILATSSRDHSIAPEDAMVYAVFVGWGCEEHHTHDEFCGGDPEERLGEFAARLGWSADTVARLRAYRAAVAALTTQEPR